MVEEVGRQPVPHPKQSFSLLQVLGMVVASTLIAVVTTVLILKLYLFPSSFSPVELSPKESQRLAAKLEDFAEFDPACANPKRRACRRRQPRTGKVQ